MSNMKDSHHTPYFSTALVVSSLPIAYNLSRSFLSGCTKQIKLQDFVSLSEMNERDENAKHPDYDADSKYNSPWLSSTIESHDSYRTGISNSFTTMNNVTGLFSSLTPHSVVGVFTLENASNCHSEAYFSEPFIPSCANVFQMCGMGKETNWSGISNVSSNAAEEELEINKSELAKAPKRTNNSSSPDGEFSNIVIGKPLRSQVFATSSLQECPVHGVPGLMI